MEIRRLSPEEFRCGSHPFQSSFWASIKTANSWIPHFLEIDGSRLLVLSRGFFHNAFSLAYVPMGPEIKVLKEPGSIRELSALLAEELGERTFAVRYDFPFDYHNQLGLLSMTESQLEAWYSDFSKREGLVLLDESIQPQGTVFNDLSKGFEYRTRARRIIKRSKGAVRVSFWDGDEEQFSLWYGIYCQTAHRDGFSARSRHYIRSLLDNPGTGDVECRLALAWVNGLIKGGIIFIRTAEYEAYLFGGAERSPEFNVSYCLQDFALSDAASSGRLVYDFHGSHGTMNRGGHLGSLTQFKLAFGGRRIFRIPSCDYVIRPFVWRLYRGAEEIRLKHSRR